MRSQMNLAHFAAARGELKEAEQLMRRVETLQARSLGTEHPV